MEVELDLVVGRLPDTDLADFALEVLKENELLRVDVDARNDLCRKSQSHPCGIVVGTLVRPLVDAFVERCCNLYAATLEHIMGGLRDHQARPAVTAASDKSLESDLSVFTGQQDHVVWFVLGFVLGCTSWCFVQSLHCDGRSRHAFAFRSVIGRKLVGSEVSIRLRFMKWKYYFRYGDKHLHFVVNFAIIYLYQSDIIDTTYGKKTKNKKESRSVRP